MVINNRSKVTGQKRGSVDYDRGNFWPTILDRLRKNLERMPGSEKKEQGIQDVVLFGKKHVPKRVAKGVLETQKSELGVDRLQPRLYLLFHAFYKRVTLILRQIRISNLQSIFNFTTQNLNKKQKDEKYIFCFNLAFIGATMIFKDKFFDFIFNRLPMH